MFDSRINEFNNPPARGKAGAGDGGDINGASPPAISAPKGGGAIRGIGEKFTANPVTGTGSLSAPIHTSPGRSGFGPQLSLSYDSGAGNGPFGFGWGLSLPQITRKTDRGLPKYQDADESDVFILSGTEDLTPALKEADGRWSRHAFDRSLDDRDYKVQLYRPRVEGLFARIERWTDKNDRKNIFWRSISKENITTWYGKSEESRIVDLADPTRIFSWLICESYNDKGDAILYQYKKEDSSAIDLAQAHERNRTESVRSANRYLKRIRYCNRTPRQPNEDLAQRSDWLFEAVFDYGEHDADNPMPDDTGQWLCRHDPFSSYRAGFELRTYRLCQRVLMFHHFAEEPSVGMNCLARSTDFTYRQTGDNPDERKKGQPAAAFIASITQTGYKRQPGGGYLRQSLPPLECEYSQPIVNEEVRDIDPRSLENLPQGLDGARYEWIDLDGEGIPGILTRQAEGWFYKRNLSPVPVIDESGYRTIVARFAPMEPAPLQPSIMDSSARRRFIDLEGDGRIDLAGFNGQLSGYYEREQDGGWSPFVPFETMPNIDWDDPNLKFVDLTGDGRADILISEDDLFVWYPSRGEAGFGSSERVAQASEEEKGPRLIFADGEESIYLADLSGDGLTDLARIRNGEICYWPNLGYGRFGAKVVMDNAPWFDAPDLFDQRRIQLADIDGSGVTDIIYLGGDGVRLYFNQSGNRWSEPHTLKYFPRIETVSAVSVMDLLGAGTACLVWSSPLPADSGHQMRYVDLMGGLKPHLLIKTTNNLGAETRVDYSSSTRFYLEDKLAGKPWGARIPFPVHVVERVETHDRISGNRFVTRYAYHHGCFDGEEREFRGFGMVEQWDTEEISALTESDRTTVGNNFDPSSHVPPILTRSWFHTGVYLGRDRISNIFAGLLNDGDAGEYYRKPGLSDEDAKKLLLDDTPLPQGLTIDEEREACRALKGLMLRQEVYALDGTDKERQPYSVTEQNFSIRRLQPGANNRHAVFFTHPREAINYHYERDPENPRATHILTLDVDEYGAVLKSASIGYGRLEADTSLSTAESEKQTTSLVTYSENRFTNAIDADAGDDYRSPLKCESMTYELTGYVPSASNSRFQSSDFVENTPGGPIHVFDSEISYEEAPGAGRQRRLIEHARAYYRMNDLTSCLPLSRMESLALPCGSFKLAFTPGLLSNIYRRSGVNQPPENLLPNPGDILGGNAADQGGYVDLDGDGNWWIPSGMVFYASSGDAAQELAEARQHFFLPKRFTDPFGHDTTVDYQYDLLITGTTDAMGNTAQAVNDYRALQPRLVMDPNGNRSEVVFDVLGMVTGMALRGKITENLGDSLAGFVADLTPEQINDFFEAEDPHLLAPGLLGDATSRTIYDLDRFRRARQAHPNDPDQWIPVFAATLSRETHASEPLPPDGLKAQISFSYSDGFGREIQQKIQAEPGPLVPGGPIVSPRWVVSGWTIFNNKSKPVRRYEPFFSATHGFEFGVQTGVSPILFYDPVERVVATLHPNHAYEKVIFDSWRQCAWDVNDTALLDPRTDDDIGGLTENYFALLDVPPSDWRTWYAQRADGELGAEQRNAAIKTSDHAFTPTAIYFDALGRPFLTVANNGPDAGGDIRRYKTRINLDIEGNQREVIDARDRIVMRYGYDMLGNRIHQAGMEAGERWILNDVTGKPIRAWDSRRHRLRIEYDQLRRPLSQFALGTDPNLSDPRTLNQETLFEKIEYGESQPNAIAMNLRTRVFRQFDGAGIVTSEAYDFKGNLLLGNRRLTQDYKALPNWSGTVQMEAAVYQSGATYDALNRPVTMTAPDNSVVHPRYNQANLLDAVEVNLRGAAVATTFVAGIDYDAKGQRALIDYGNGVQTTYEYDPLTFRLTRMRTLRGNDRLQDLTYTYDSAGNVTHIHDDAQQTIYFRNRIVEPSNDYAYDAVYRLIAATGREHLGQAGGAPIPHSYNDSPRVGIDWSANDGNAMGTYRQQYFYDEVGNFIEMIHRGADPANPGWTRAYSYDEDSLLESNRKSNRLTRAIINPNSAQPQIENYAHDIHGNMAHMPQLQVMQWDFKDQLLMTRRQAVNPNDEDGLQRQGERSYYVYDSEGRRARKVTEFASGQLKDERIYLGSFEIYRRQGVNAVVRETLSVMDDNQRIALVEIRTQGNDGSPAQLIRRQFGNHLGSASLELDHDGQIISYEEYYPYGGSSYQAARSQTEARKRYRYTGKERDEESGLYYHGARYYAPWLGRWVSADRAGLVDGPNLYAYVLDNPLSATDPTGSQSRPTQEQVRKIANQVQADIRKAIGPGSIKGLDVGHLVSVDDLYSQYGKHLTAEQWRRLFSGTGELYALESLPLNRSKQELSSLQYFGSKNPGIGGLTEAQTDYAKQLTREASYVFDQNVQRLQADPNARIGDVEDIAGIVRNRVVETTPHAISEWGSTPETTTQIRKSVRGGPPARKPSLRINLKSPGVRAGLITVIVGGIFLYDRLAIAETLNQDKGQVYVDFAAEAWGGLAPTPDNVASTLLAVPLFIEYLEQRRQVLQAADPAWIAEQEAAQESAQMINLYLSTGEVDPAMVPNLIYYDEGLVITAPQFKQYRYK